MISYSACTKEYLPDDPPCSMKVRHDIDMYVNMDSETMIMIAIIQPSILNNDCCSDFSNCCSDSISDCLDSISDCLDSISDCLDAYSDCLDAYSDCLD